jgi:hypothetical protein
MSNKEETIQKIKSKGYWEVNIRPDVYNSQRIKKNEIEDLIRRSAVSLRGWSYPVCGLNRLKPYRILNGIENAFDSSDHAEFWRMTQSANFYHLLTLREDWREDISHLSIWGKKEDLKDKKLLGILGTLYTLTEIFEFAKRLASKNIFDENVIVEIKLYNLNDRILVVDSYNRVPFSYNHVAKISEPWSFHQKQFSVAEILSKSDEFAINAYIDLLYLFEFDNPPIDSLKNDQQKFLQGRI